MRANAVHAAVARRREDLELRHLAGNGAEVVAHDGGVVTPLGRLWAHDPEIVQGGARDGRAVELPLVAQGRCPAHSDRKIKRDRRVCKMIRRLNGDDRWLGCGNDRRGHKCARPEYSEGVRVHKFECSTIERFH